MGLQKFLESLPKQENKVMKTILITVGIFESSDCRIFGLNYISSRRHDGYDAVSVFRSECV